MDLGYDGDEFKHLILPMLIGEDEIAHVLAELETPPRDAVPQAERVKSALTKFMQKRQWDAVTDVLTSYPSFLSEDVRTRATREACRHANDLDLRRLVHHCPDDQLDALLPQLVSRNSGWWVVQEVLQRGISSRQQRRWVMRQALQRSLDWIINDFLPDYADDMPDRLLAGLTRRAMWVSVSKVLQQQQPPLRVSDAERRWVIHKASRVATGSLFLQWIFPHCGDDQVESVLTQLVALGKWQAVSEVLRQRREAIRAPRRKWAIEEASERAPESRPLWDIISQCSPDWLESVLVKLVKRGAWEAAREVAERGVGDEVYAWAVLRASLTASEFSVRRLVEIWPEESVCRIVILACQRGMPSVAGKMLKRIGWDPLLSEVIVSAASLTQPNSEVTQPNSEVTQPSTLNREVTQPNSEVSQRDSEVTQPNGEVTQPNSEVTQPDSEVTQPDSEVTQPNSEHIYTATDDRTRSLMSFVCGEVLDVIAENTETETAKTGREPPHISQHLANQIKEWTEIFEGLDRPSSLQTSSFELFFTLYYHSRREGQSTGDHVSGSRRENPRPSKDRHLLLALTVLPVFPELQNAALAIMQRERRWDIISHACLTHAWEQVRRELLRAAAEQGQWGVVKRWADHSLYDDQRGWALQEAFKEKQWDVFLLLADHGLERSELMRVHYRLVKYAGWDVVLRLLERGGDLVELAELMQATKRGKKNLEDPSTAACYKRRRIRLARLWRKLSGSSVADAAAAFANSDWRLVLFKLRQEAHEVDVSRAAEAALRSEAWHVLVQLVRLGMDAAQRDCLFPEMVRRRQWGVCRALLERGLRVESCLAAVPELMKMNQWILLARVMERDVGDAVRRQILQHAMERREGSLVAHFLGTTHERLSVEEREALFQQSLSRGVWQALKPLVQERDSTGIAHRDIAMHKAAEQGQWDVVDHCERYYADINKHNADGDTPLLRAAWRADWKAVEELVRRGCDQFVLDSDGSSVLHKALEAGQPAIAKLLIQFHGDVNLPDRDGVTPLQMLIERRHADIIDDMLFWQSDVCTGGYSKSGGTTLHAACEAGWLRTLYYLLARRVDPLAVTEDGESVLMLAVQNPRCPQRLVAECIRLGFSTHQPFITDACYVVLDEGRKARAMKAAPRSEEGDLETLYAGVPGVTREMMTQIQDRDLWDSENFSPFHFALVRDMPVVRDMLYESGACSYKELFRLYTDVSEGSSFCYDATTDLPYLRKAATTPRSLRSACRLVISHCLDVRGKRHQDVEDLDLEESLQNYVMFSDLADPDFGKDRLL